MRLASFNVENLFDRARVLNQNEWITAPGTNPSRMSAARQILENFAKLNAILAQPVYSDADKLEIIRLLKALGLEKADENRMVILRRNRGSLVKRPPGGGEVIVTANGRDDWIGWLDLQKEAVNQTATQNTARVFKEVNADAVVVVEAENRTSLVRFNEQVIEVVEGRPYDHVMLIDGNDERGIDVGLMTRSTVGIDVMRSHVDDLVGQDRIFSRDCPEFHLVLPGGQRLVVLANHFKSKGYGDAATSNARRKAQAQRVREIYDGLIASGVDYVAVAGDFNDTPDSDPLSPLLGNGSLLKDISEHPAFDFAGRPGTYGNATKDNKIDFILLSPKLYAKATGGGIFRKGVWGGKNGDLWPHFSEIENASQAASDHAAIFADFEF